MPWDLRAPLDLDLDADADAQGRAEVNPPPGYSRSKGGCWTLWAILSHRCPPRRAGAGWELDPSLTRKRP